MKHLRLIVDNTKRSSKLKRWFKKNRDTIEITIMLTVLLGSLVLLGVYSGS